MFTVKILLIFLTDDIYNLEIYYNIKEANDKIKLTKNNVIMQLFEIFINLPNSNTSLESSISFFSFLKSFIIFIFENGILRKTRLLLF